MRKHYAFAIAATAAGLGAILSGGQRPSDPRTSPVPETALARETEGPPDEWLLAARLSGDAITPAQLRRASLQAEDVGRMTEATQPLVAEPGWTFEGPDVIGGRITDLAVHPLAPNTVLPLRALTTPAPPKSPGDFQKTYSSSGFGPDRSLPACPKPVSTSAVARAWASLVAA